MIEGFLDIVICFDLHCFSISVEKLSKNSVLFSFHYYTYIPTYEIDCCERVTEAYMQIISDALEEVKIGNRFEIIATPISKCDHHFMHVDQELTFYRAKQCSRKQITID